MKPGGTGNITASHIAWEKTKGIPYVPSPLLYRGALFMIKDGGLASCFDAATGVPHYEQQRLEKLLAAVICAVIGAPPRRFV